jgi:hypothetical protein
MTVQCSLVFDIGLNQAEDTDTSDKLFRFIFRLVHQLLLGVEIV